MKTLKASILAALVLAATNFSMAQATAQQTAAERAQFQTERMTQELNLSEEQQARIADINFAIASKNEAVRKDLNFTPAQKQEALQGNIDGRYGLLKHILTAEQLQIHDQKTATRLSAGIKQTDEF